MTDKEKLQHILDTCDSSSIENIFYHYLMEYFDELPISTIKELHNQTNNVLGAKIEDMSRANYIAYERATYLKSYLNGSMWRDEKSAKENLPRQIDNAQAIIDAVGRR